MAHSKKLVAILRSHIYWVAPLHVYAGEDELQALAEGLYASFAVKSRLHEYGAVAIPAAQRSISKQATRGR